MIVAALLRIGSRLRLYLALAGIAISALWLAFARGRSEARAHLAVRSAEARIRSLTTAKEVTHDIDTLPQAERDRRLDRWMRD